ncbi:MAG: hypothetical protein ABWY92_16265 [Xanthobacteraceae bacterium]|jgi:hypothetical protein
MENVAICRFAEIDRRPKLAADLIRRQGALIVRPHHRRTRHNARDEQIVAQRTLTAVHRPIVSRSGQGMMAARVRGAAAVQAFVRARGQHDIFFMIRVVVRVPSSTH